MRKAARGFLEGEALLDLCAVLAGLAVSLLLVLSRLPASDDFILPRRPGFALFQAAIRASSSPQGHRAFSWAALLLLAAAGLALLWRLARGARSSWPALRAMGPWALAGRGGLCLVGLLGLAAAARFASALALDLIQNAWFPPESVDPLETFATWAAVFFPADVFLRSGGALLGWGAARGGQAMVLAKVTAGLAAVLLVPTAALYAWGAAAYDIRRRSLAEAAGIEEGARGFRTVVILTEKGGRPANEVHAIELGIPGRSEYSPASLLAAQSYVARPRTVFTRPALRYLYGGYTLQMSPEALRLALFLGHLSDDVLARVLLLDSLAVAPPGAGKALYLGAIADEASYRIGPKGAARIALAYAHLGVRDRAAYWRKRASEGEGGIPAGLLELPEGGSLDPGLIRGSVRGAKKVRVGLYSRRDPSMPYALGPAQLVDAAATDAKGRFEFKGLAAGDYFLALAVDSAKPADEKKVRVRGNKGDIRLSPKRPKVELPPIELGF